MFLSIVSIFCDNDYKMVQKLLLNIEEKVKIPHEIILIDNREKFKDDPVQFASATVYSKGCNVYQFEARRYAVQFCKGDYIWFIDSDDTILSVKEDLSFTEDLILFNHANDTGVISLSRNFYIRKQLLGDERSVSIKSKDIKNYIDKNDPYSTCCCTLWNKWLKKELAEKIVAMIPEDKIIVASEDILYSALAIEHSNTICFCKDVIYLYNEKLAKGFSKTMTTQRFFHIIKGRKESKEIFRKLFSNPGFYDNMNDSVFYFTIKAFESDNPKECLKEMKNHFTNNELSLIYNTEYFAYLTKDKQNLIKKIFG